MNFQIFNKRWTAKPSTSRNQFLLFAGACRSAEFARRRGISRQVACENFLADMRKACRNAAHRRLIGVSRVAACRRAREGIGGGIRGKKAITQAVRDWLLASLAAHRPGRGCPPGQHRDRNGRCVPNKQDISVDDLATEGGLLSPDQGGEKCPRGQVREPITGRCVPKGRRRG